MDEFVVGGLYSKEEIENKDFVNTRTTKIFVFYRKDNNLLVFEHCKPQGPKRHKLISRLAD
ncbi:MAG: hypothetical protein WCL51_08025 [Bacteroidota bacterium]